MNDCATPGAAVGSQSKVLRSISLADVNEAEGEGIKSTQPSRSELIAAARNSRSAHQLSIGEINAQPQDYVISDGKVLRVKKAKPHNSRAYKSNNILESSLDSLDESLQSSIWGIASPIPEASISPRDSKLRGTTSGGISSTINHERDTTSGSSEFRNGEELRMLRKRVEELQARIMIQDKRISELQTENETLRRAQDTDAVQQAISDTSRNSNSSSISIQQNNDISNGDIGNKDLLNDSVATSMTSGSVRSVRSVTGGAHLSAAVGGALKIASSSSSSSGGSSNNLVKKSLLIINPNDVSLQHDSIADHSSSDENLLQFVTPKSFAETPRNGKFFGASDEHFVSAAEENSMKGASTSSSTLATTATTTATTATTAAVATAGAAVQNGASANKASKSSPRGTQHVRASGGRERCESINSTHSIESSVTVHSVGSADLHRGRTTSAAGGGGSGCKLAQSIVKEDTEDTLDSEDVTAAETPSSAGFYSADGLTTPTAEITSASIADAEGSGEGTTTAVEQTITPKSLIVESSVAARNPKGGSVILFDSTVDASSGEDALNNDTNNNNNNNKNTSARRGARKRLPPQALAARLALGSTERRKLAHDSASQSNADTSIGSNNKGKQRTRMNPTLGTSGRARLTGAGDADMSCGSSCHIGIVGAESPLSLPSGTIDGCCRNAAGDDSGSDSIPSIQSNNKERGTNAALTRSTSILARRLMNARSQSSNLSNNSLTPTAENSDGALRGLVAATSPIVQQQQQQQQQQHTQPPEMEFKWMDNAKKAVAEGRSSIHLFLAHDNPQLGASVATLLRKGVRGGDGVSEVGCMLECKDESNPQRTLFLTGQIQYSGDFARIESAHLQQPRGSACIVVTNLNAVFGDIKGLTTNVRNDIIEIDLLRVPSGYDVPIRSDQDLKKLFEVIKSRVDVILHPYHTDHQWYPYWEGRRRMAPQFRSQGIGYLRLGDDMSEYGSAFMSLDAGATYLDNGASAAVSGKFKTRESPFRATHNHLHLTQFDPGAELHCDSLNGTLRASLRAMQDGISSSAASAAAGAEAAAPMGVAEDTVNAAGLMDQDAAGNRSSGAASVGTPRRIKSMRLASSPTVRGANDNAAATTTGGSGTPTLRKVKSFRLNDLGYDSGNRDEMENRSPLLRNSGDHGHGDAQLQSPPPNLFNFVARAQQQQQQLNSVPKASGATSKGQTQSSKPTKTVPKVDIEPLIQQIKDVFYELIGTTGNLRWSDRADLLNKLSDTLGEIGTLGTSQLPVFVSGQSQLLSQCLTLLVDTIGKQKNPHVLAASIACLRRFTYGSLLTQYCWLPWRSALLEGMHLLRNSNRLVCESGFVCMVDLYLCGAYTLSQLCSFIGEVVTGIRGSGSNESAENRGATKIDDSTGTKTGNNTSGAVSRFAADKGKGKLKTTAANTSRVIMLISSILQKCLDQSILDCCLRDRGKVDDFSADAASSSSVRFIAQHSDIAALLASSLFLLSHREEVTRDATSNMWACALVCDIVARIHGGTAALLSLSTQLSKESADCTFMGSDEGSSGRDSSFAKSRFAKSLHSPVCVEVQVLRECAPRAFEKVLHATTQLISKYALNAAAQVAAIVPTERATPDSYSSSSGATSACTDTSTAAAPDGLSTAPVVGLAAIKETVGLVRSGKVVKGRSRSRRPSIDSGAATDTGSYTSNGSTVADGGSNWGSSDSRDPDDAPTRNSATLLTTDNRGRRTSSRASSAKKSGQQQPKRLDEAPAPAEAQIEKDAVGEDHVVVRIRLSTMWFESKHLLRKCPSSDSEWQSIAQMATVDAPLFFHSLSAMATATNYPKGLLLRHILPFNEDTNSADQAAPHSAAPTNSINQIHSDSKLAPTPEALAGREVELNQLAAQAVHVRSMIRVKMADEADFEQAREAVRMLGQFVKAVDEAVANTHSTAFDMLQLLD